LPAQAPKLDTSFTAYIYTQEELRELLQAIIPERTGGLSPQTVRALLLLLYGAGLRISEALKLEISDVDLEERVLCVRQSKFFKTRLVPIGPKLAEVLRDYERKRPGPDPSNRCFFRAKNGSPVSRSTIERIFAKLRLAAGVKRTDGGRFQPRLHDLRHTAAVHRLVAWYRKGADVQSLLIKLSAYLGHVDIAATQKYLTWTPELRKQANARFARYALGGSND
jgi:integrase